MSLPMAAPEPPLTPSRRVMQFLRRLLERHSAALSDKKEAISRAADVLARNGIEFTWSIGHYEHEAFDVPYITTVLDLQHRLQPWFPET